MCTTIVAIGFPLAGPWIHACVIEICGSKRHNMAGAVVHVHAVLCKYECAVLCKKYLHLTNEISTELMVKVGPNLSPIPSHFCAAGVLCIVSRGKMQANLRWVQRSQARLDPRLGCTL